MRRPDGSHLRRWASLAAVLALLALSMVLLGEQALSASADRGTPLKSPPLGQPAAFQAAAAPASASSSPVPPGDQGSTRTPLSAPAPIHKEGKAPAPASPTADKEALSPTPVLFPLSPQVQEGPLPPAPARVPRSVQEEGMLPVFILAPEWQELPERLGAGGGAPVFAPAGRPLGGATLTAPPLAGSTDLVVCMSTDRVWGLLDAGSTVTVTVGTAQMGAAQADGVGFFWTTLYDGSGDRPGLDGEESVAVYQDGVQQASLTLRAITATLYLVTDTVVGQVDTNTPLSVTVYAMDDQLPEPTMTTYSQTVSTDGSGNFTVDLTGIWDFIG